MDGAWGSVVMFVIAGLAAYILSKKVKSNLHLLVAIFLGTTYGMLALRMWVLRDWSAKWWVVGSLVTFALGFGAWKLDRAKKTGRWGHGFWHLATGAASALVFYAAHLVSAIQRAR